VTKNTKATNKLTVRKTFIVEITCRDVWRALGDYLESEIDEDLGPRIQEHFRHCNHCRALLDGASNIIQVVGDGRAFDVPPGFGSRLYTKLEAHLAKQRKKES